MDAFGIVGLESSLETMLGRTGSLRIDWHLELSLAGDPDSIIIILLCELFFDNSFDAFPG